MTLRTIGRLFGRGGQPQTISNTAAIAPHVVPTHVGVIVDHLTTNQAKAILGGTLLAGPAPAELDIDPRYGRVSYLFQLVDRQVIAAAGQGEVANAQLANLIGNTVVAPITVPSRAVYDALFYTLLCRSQERWSHLYASVGAALGSSDLIGAMLAQERDRVGRAVHEAVAEYQGKMFEVEAHAVHEVEAFLNPYDATGLADLPAQQFLRTLDDMALLAASRVAPQSIVVHEVTEMPSVALEALQGQAPRIEQAAGALFIDADPVGPTQDAAEDPGETAASQEIASFIDTLAQAGGARVALSGTFSVLAQSAEDARAVAELLLQLQLQHRAAWLVNYVPQQVQTVDPWRPSDPEQIPSHR